VFARTHFPSGADFAFDGKDSTTLRDLLFKIIQRGACAAPSMDLTP
jgi:hypothetical protein